MKEKNDFSMRHVVGCTDESCKLHSHYIQVNNHNLIFQQPEFEVAHHSSSACLWISNPHFKCQQQGKKDMGEGKEKRAYSIMTSHHLYSSLSCQYASRGRNLLRVISKMIPTNMMMRNNCLLHVTSCKVFNK